MALDMIASIKFLQYIHKLLDGERDSLLKYPYTPQKPCPHISELGEKLPRCSIREAGVSAVQLEAFFRKLCSKYGIGAHNILMCRYGKVFCEASWAPYRTNMWHVTHSLCKSITGTAIGLLIGEGRLTLQDKIASFFEDEMPMISTSNLRSITVRDLLMMSSGIRFKEVDSVLEQAWMKSFLRASQEFKPGTQFDYNSMNSYMLAAIVKKVTGVTMMEYLKAHLFRQLGIRDVAWEKSPEQIEKGGWGMYMLPEDVAKIGLLYLQNGVWNGKQILSKEWVQQATQTQITAEKNRELYEYGYHIWTRQRDGMFQFNGMFGQYMVAFPKWDILIVMNCGNAHTGNTAYALSCMDEFIENGKLFEQQSRFREWRAAENLRGKLKKLVIEEAYGFRYAKTTKADIEFLEKFKNKKFFFSKNSVGLLPMILQCMSGNYSRGLCSLKIKDQTIYWREKDELYTLPFCLNGSCECKLNIHGETYLAATVAALEKDENRESYLKIRLCFLESSSMRLLKIYLKDDGVWIACKEEPGFEIVQYYLSPSSAMDRQILKTNRRELGYTEYKVQGLFEPILFGYPQKERSGKE